MRRNNEIITIYKYEKYKKQKALSLIPSPHVAGICLPYFCLPATLHQGNSTLPIISSLQLSADLPLLLFWSYGTQNVIRLHSVPLHFVSSLIIVALILSFFLTPKMFLSIPLCVVTSLLVCESVSWILSSDNNSIEVEMAIPHLVDNISC